jgi:hypothetical protein
MIDSAGASGSVNPSAQLRADATGDAALADELALAEADALALAEADALADPEALPEAEPLAAVDAEGGGHTHWLPISPPRALKEKSANGRRTSAARAMTCRRARDERPTYM